MIAVESSNRQQICQRLRDPFAKKFWSCRNPAVVTATDRMEIAQLLSVTPEPKCDTRFSLLSCALLSLIRPLPSNSSRPPFRSASSERHTSRSLARLTSLAVSRRSVGLTRADHRFSGRGAVQRRRPDQGGSAALPYREGIVPGPGRASGRRLERSKAAKMA